MWVSSSEYWNAKWRLTENIKLAFDEEGIEIPFKQVVDFSNENVIK